MNTKLCYNKFLTCFFFSLFPIFPIFNFNTMSSIPYGNWFLGYTKELDEKFQVDFCSTTWITIWDIHCVHANTCMSLTRIIGGRTSSKRNILRPNWKLTEMNHSPLSQIVDMVRMNPIIRRQSSLFTSLFELAWKNRDIEYRRSK